MCLTTPDVKNVLTAKPISQVSRKPIDVGLVSNALRYSEGVHEILWMLPFDIAVLYEKARHDALICYSKNGH